MTLEEMFDAADDEFLRFERIPEGERRHVRPDLCAFLYLHEKLGGSGDIVQAAEHDEIFLAYTVEDCEGKLTQDDVTYLHRCGVRNGEYGLCMFA